MASALIDARPRLTILSHSDTDAPSIALQSSHKFYILFNNIPSCAVNVPGCCFLLMILFTQLRQTCFLVVQLLSQSGHCTSFLKCFPHPDNFLPFWKLSQSRIVTIPWICTSFAELSIVMVKLLSFRTFVTTRTRYYAVVKLMSKNGEKTLTHIIAEIYRYPADFSGIRPDTGFD